MDGIRRSGQSPVDLIDEICEDRSFPPLKLTGHWSDTGDASLINVGTTVQVTLSDRTLPNVSGGPLLDDVFEFKNAHFHWGEDDCYGCEHTINGTWYSMEAHVVHWNKKYGSIEESVQYPDGICILAYLFLVTTESARDNPWFDRVTEKLKFVRNADTKTPIAPSCLFWMREATSCSSYYTYSGSYTVSPYSECVIWIVFPVMIPIQSYHVNQFRKLKDRNGDLLRSNNRKIQPLRGRTIYRAVAEGAGNA